MLYARAKCTGMTSPTLYFEYETDDVDLFKYEIIKYVGSFDYFSIACAEEDIQLVDKDILDKSLITLGE